MITTMLSPGDLPVIVGVSVALRESWIWSIGSPAAIVAFLSKGKAARAKN